MAVDNRLGDVENLAAAVLGVVAKKLEGSLVIESVTLHQDALGPLDHGATAECALEAVVFRKPAQHDVDRALDLRRLTVRDVGEDSALGG